MAEVTKWSELGDVEEILHDDGSVERAEPSTWNWTGWINDPGEWRRSIGSLKTLPGFAVSEPSECKQIVPGPRPTPTWNGTLRDGRCPGARVTSGGGTGARFNRVSEAAGHVAVKLPGRPLVNGSTQMFIEDFSRGELTTVTYTPPSAEGHDNCRVYVIDDGHAFKIGYTGGVLAVRMANLQTGNPRELIPVAEIAGADEAIELRIHDQLGDQELVGEWFDRNQLIRQIASAGSVRTWLARLAGVEPDRIHVHPPYAQ